MRVEERLGLASEIANHLRLPAGLHIGVLHPFHCRLPIVAEAEVARGLLHLTEREGVLPLGNGDQLLRRIRNHLVREIFCQPNFADRVTNDRSVGGRASAGARTAGTTAPHVRGQDGGRDADDPLSQRARIADERGVEPSVGRLDPPGELRIVAVVVAVPVRNDPTDLIDVVGRAIGNRAGDFGGRRAGPGRGVGRRRGEACRAGRGARVPYERAELEQRAHAVHLADDLRDCARGGGWVDRNEIAACVLKCQQSIGEGQERGSLAALPVVAVEDGDLVREEIIEEDVVGTALRIQHFEIQLAQARVPGHGKSAHAAALVGRIGCIVAARKRLLIGGESLDDGCQIADRSRDERAELGDRSEGIDDEHRRRRCLRRSRGDSQPDHEGERPGCDD